MVESQGSVSGLVGFSIFINGPHAKSKLVLVKVVDDAWLGGITSAEKDWMIA